MKWNGKMWSYSILVDKTDCRLSEMSCVLEEILWICLWVSHRLLKFRVGRTQLVEKFSSPLLAKAPGIENFLPGIFMCFPALWLQRLCESVGMFHPLSFQTNKLHSWDGSFISFLSCVTWMFWFLLFITRQRSQNANVPLTHMMHAKSCHVHFVVRMDVEKRAHHILVAKYQRFSQKLHFQTFVWLPWFQTYWAA